MKASQVPMKASLVPKNLSANAAAGGQETQVLSLGWEDSEEGMANIALFLHGELSWTGACGVCMGWQSRTLLKQFIMHIYMFIEKAICYNNFFQ